MRAMMVANLTGDTDSSRVDQGWRSVEKVAALIRSLMVRRKLTNADLSRKLGKDPGYVSRVLAGKMNLTLRTVGDLLWALGLSLEVGAKPIEADSLARRPVSWAEEWGGGEQPNFWSRWRTRGSQPSSSQIEHQTGEESGSHLPAGKELLS